MMEQQYLPTYSLLSDCGEARAKTPQPSARSPAQVLALEPIADIVWLEVDFKEASKLSAKKKKF